jgi:outer membrane protein assembly factor BamB
MTSSRWAVAIATAVALTVVTGCTSGRDVHGASHAARTTPVTSPPAATAPAPTAPAKLPNGVLASIQLDPGSAPAPVVAGFGSLWVAAHRGPILYRIDPRREEIVARIDLKQNTCGPLFIGGGLIWTNHCADGSRELAVDPRVNQVVGSLNGLVFGFADGNFWALSHDGRETLRIDPSNLRAVTRLPVAGIQGAVANGYLWLAGGSLDTGQYNGVIKMVSMRTGRLVGRIRTRRTVSYPFFTRAANVLWMKGATDSFLIAIDMPTGRASTVAVNNIHPAYSFGDEIPVAAMGSLWVRTADDTVSRLDARTGHIQATYPADPAGAGGYVAVDAGSLWVANFGSDTIWRDRITKISK